MKLEHTYAGRCPDATQPLSLDPRCPACRATGHGWAVITPQGRPLMESFRRTRDEAIWWAVWAEDENWKPLYRRGYRCVRYTLTPAEAL